MDFFSSQVYVRPWPQNTHYITLTKSLLHYVGMVFLCPLNEKLLHQLPLSKSLHVSDRLCLSAVQWPKIAGKTQRCALF